MTSLDHTISAHLRRVMHLFISKLCKTGSDNGLSPISHQAIVWVNSYVLAIAFFHNNLQWKFDSKYIIFTKVTIVFAISIGLFMISLYDVPVFVPYQHLHRNVFSFFIILHLELLTT